MSVSQLPNGRWRAQVYDPETAKSVSAAKILGLDSPSFSSKREAERARERARDRMAEQRADCKVMTVARWWDLWTTNPLYERPKPATNINNAERTQAFTKRFAGMLMSDVDRKLVMAWLQEDAKRQGAVKCLRTMFSDALDAEVIVRNPFARLRISLGKGNAERPVPSQELVWEMIHAAREQCPPGFAAWLQVACFTGMRSGELDALCWDDVDFDGGWLHVRRQFCSKGFVFTAPKNGKARKVPMHEPARQALESLPRESEYVFVNGRRGHWTKPSRAYQWNKVRRAVGWTESLYLATRHFAGKTMFNDMLLSAEDVAEALGHTDKGDLVRKLYGHLDADEALQRVKDAYVRTETDELARRRRRAA